MWVCRVVGWVLLAFFLSSLKSSAAEAGSPSVVVVLKDGSRLTGVVVSEDEKTLTIRTAFGVEVPIARSLVESLEPSSVVAAPAAPQTPAPEFSDPNDARLMFAPSGRPLGKGDGYFSDHYVVFPGFAYGLTDHVSVAGGFSTVPGLNLQEQVFYVSSTAGWRLSPRTAFTLGGAYASSSDAEEAGALFFGVGRFGSNQRSLSLGLGLAAARDEEILFDRRGEYAGSRSRWSFRDAPIAMVGGTFRISRRLSFVTENWLLLGKGFRLSQQPLGAAIRFLGDRLTVDFGFVVVPAVLDEGFPLPWLSFSYHFGPSRSAARQRAKGAFPGLDLGRRRLR